MVSVGAEMVFIQTGTLRSLSQSLEAGFSEPGAVRNILSDHLFRV